MVKWYMVRPRPVHLGIRICLKKFNSSLVVDPFDIALHSPQINTFFYTFGTLNLKDKVLVGGRIGERKTLWRPTH